MTITLDSPSNRNALSSALVAGLHACFDSIDAQGDGVRVVVLDHDGPAFCSGADLRERSAGVPGAGMAEVARAIERLSAMPYPTIAAVRGPVRAGGVGLMAACDLVVVDAAVTFAFTEVRLGVAPAMISVPVLRRCSWSAVAGPFLTGEPFDAETARRIGLVSHVTDDVTATVDHLVGGVLAAAPRAVAATKALLRRPGTMAEMVELSERLFAGPDAADGIAAFLEKRPPSWAVGR